MTDEHGVSHKRHIGDGAYVEVGAFHGEVILSTPSARRPGREILPIHSGNRVHLDGASVRQFVQWLVERGWKIKLGEDER